MKTKDAKEKKVNEKARNFVKLSGKHNRENQNLYSVATNYAKKSKEVPVNDHIKNTILCYCFVPL